jgi:hypothetical protein
MDLRKILMTIPAIDRNQNAVKDKVYEDEIIKPRVEENHDSGDSKKNKKAKKEKGFAVLPKLDEGVVSLKTIIAEKPKSKVVIQYLKSRIDKLMDEDMSSSDEE